MELNEEHAFRGRIHEIMSEKHDALEQNEALSTLDDEGAIRVNETGREEVRFEKNRIWQRGIGHRTTIMPIIKNANLFDVFMLNYRLMSGCLKLVPFLSQGVAAPTPQPDPRQAIKQPARVEQRLLAGLYQDQPEEWEWDDPLPVLRLVTIQCLPPHEFVHAVVPVGSKTEGFPVMLPGERQFLFGIEPGIKHREVVVGVGIGGIADNRLLEMPFGFVAVFSLGCDQTKGQMGVRVLGIQLDTDLHFFDRFGYPVLAPVDDTEKIMRSSPVIIVGEGFPDGYFGGGKVAGEKRDVRIEACSEVMTRRPERRRRQTAVQIENCSLVGKRSPLFLRHRSQRVERATGVVDTPRETQ